MNKIEIDIGNSVICDSCDRDFSQSTEQGGIIFCSSGYCPNCAPRMLRNAEKYDETKYINAICPEGMTFRDFILKERAGNNKIVFQGFDDDDEIIKRARDRFNGINKQA